ncbi:sensor histidine kinase [Paenibacillus macerans]|uniref:sensor histidine kinase n=1 Tax=Paenibacillus macerans TaxID=44252 RepID=UPI00204020B3|nr:sensor histidine kinase [Paenibacillus macerans]MCM3703717.1 sensor histidine kinase [Paenibacillus macerans]
MSLIKRSLFTKILLGLLTVTIVPFLISSYMSYQIIGRSVQDQLVQTNQKSMAITMSSVHKYVHDIMLLTLSYYGDPELMRLLTKKELQTPAEAVYINQKMQRLFGSYTEIRSVTYKSALTNRQFNVKSGLNERQLIPDFVNRQLPAEEQRYNEEYAVIEVNGEKRLQINKLFADISSRETLGLTSVTVRNTELKQLVEPLSTSEQGDVYILLQNNLQLLYSTAPASDDSGWMTELRGKIAAADGNTMGLIHDPKGKGIYIYYTDVSYDLPITLVKFIPSSVTEQAGKQALNKSLALQVAVIGFVAIMAGVISYVILLRIKRILGQIKKIQMGNFNIQGGPQATDELGLLEDRLQDMAAELDALWNQQYRYKLEVADARLKMLQAQINPHFLYNTLQSIGTLAIKKNAHEVSDKLAELGAMFRYNMDIDHEEVLLQDELEHLNHYISLQVGRFKHKLDYSQTCPDEALSLRMPKMVLQPLVENSIVHGIEKGNGAGTIRVEIELNDRLIIRVIDNGRGFAPDMIRDIRHAYADSSAKLESRVGIGLVNVLKRLQLYYGSGFAWGIESEPYAQTTVTLSIPYQPEKEREPHESADRG